MLHVLKDTPTVPCVFAARFPTCVCVCVRGGEGGGLRACFYFTDFLFLSVLKYHVFGKADLC